MRNPTLPGIKLTTNVLALCGVGVVVNITDHEGTTSWLCVACGQGSANVSTSWEFYKDNGERSMRYTACEVILMSKKDARVVLITTK